MNTDEHRKEIRKFKLEIGWIQLPASSFNLLMAGGVLAACPSTQQQLKIEYMGEPTDYAEQHGRAYSPCYLQS